MEILPRCGPSNNAWVGRRIGYSGAHRRVYTVKGSASSHRCVDCGELAHHWSYTGDCRDEGSEVIQTKSGADVSANFCRCDDAVHYVAGCPGLLIASHGLVDFGSGVVHAW